MKPASIVHTPTRVTHFLPVPMPRKVANLTAAAGEVIAAKVIAPAVPVFVPEEVEAARLADCAERCPEKRWNPVGNAGLGECTHPECGCTGFKHKLAALACPLKVWTAWKPEEAKP